jgi:hypothetical protein
MIFISIESQGQLPEYVSTTLRRGPIDDPESFVFSSGNPSHDYHLASTVAAFFAERDGRPVMESSSVYDYEIKEPSEDELAAIYKEARLWLAERGLVELVGPGKRIKVRLQIKGKRYEDNYVAELFRAIPPDLTVEMAERMREEMRESAWKHFIGVESEIESYGDHDDRREPL